MWLILLNVYTAGGVIAGFAIIAIFASAFLFTVFSIAVAPGIIITTLLFSLLSKELVSGDIWTSSVIFSVVVGGAIWYFYRERYMKIYIMLIVAIGLLTGFYNCYINPANAVMRTVNAMYSGSFTTNAVNKNTVITGNNVNLRLSPSQGAAVVSILKENDNVIIKNENNGWVYVHVISTGQEGWVYKQYIKN